MYSLHLLLKVEIFEVFYPLCIEYVAEIAQALYVDAFSLAHAGVHHAGDVAQYSLYIRVAYCGDFRQIFGDGFRFYRFPLYDGLGKVNRSPFVE